MRKLLTIAFLLTSNLSAMDLSEELSRGRTRERVEHIDPEFVRFFLDDPQVFNNDEEEVIITQQIPTQSKKKPKTGCMPAINILRALYFAAQYHFIK